MKKVLTGYLVTEPTGNPKLPEVHKIVFRDEEGNHYELRPMGKHPEGIPDRSRYVGELIIES